MTNKLVVIINSLKYKLQLPPEPWLGGYRPQIPVLSVLCPQLNLLNPRTKLMGTPLKETVPAVDKELLQIFYNETHLPYLL
jgi:hypothetical protein